MYLCPICDHELIGSFCPVCKAMRKNPLILPDGIYLNKAHSAPDVQCEFHAGDRKSTLLNRRHPRDEKECSYHNPDGASHTESEELQPMDLRGIMRSMKTGKSRNLFDRLLGRRNDDPMKH